MDTSLYFYDSNSTSYLLANLHKAIDEVKLVKTLTHLQKQVDTIETSVGPSPRTKILRSQIGDLHRQLQDLRESGITPGVK